MTIIVWVVLYALRQDIQLNLHRNCAENITKFCTNSIIVCTYICVYYVFLYCIFSPLYQFLRKICLNSSDSVNTVNVEVVKVNCLLLTFVYMCMLILSLAWHCIHDCSLNLYVCNEKEMINDCMNVYNVHVIDYLMFAINRKN